MNIGIGVPAYGGMVTMRQISMWLSMSIDPWTRWLHAEDFVDIAGIDRARNHLVDAAIRKGVEWLFMVDADTWTVNGANVINMLQVVQDMPEVAMIGAPVPKRDPDDNHLMVYDCFPSPMPPRLYLDKVVPCETIATALCVVNLKFVREKMSPPWFKSETPDGAVKNLGEDLYFCRKARAAGGIIMVDGRFIGQHLQRPEVLHAASNP